MIMVTRVNFYLKVAGGSHLKLGKVKSLKDYRRAHKIAEFVADEAKAAGISGYNAYEVGGKYFEGGNGLAPELIAAAKFNHGQGKIVLTLVGSPDYFESQKGAFPVVKGLSTVYDFTEQEAGPAPDGGGEGENEIIEDGDGYTEEDLKKLKKVDLLEILGDDGDGSLTKSELIDIILKLKK